MCLEIEQVYLRLVASGVCKGYLQNGLVMKPFRKHPKSGKFVCIKSSLQCMNNLNPFHRNFKISRDKPTMGLSSPSKGEQTSPTKAAPTTATIDTDPQENSSASALGVLCSWDVTSARETRSSAFSQTSREQRGKRERLGTRLKIADVSPLTISPRVFGGPLNDGQRYIKLNIYIMSMSDCMKNN